MKTFFALVMMALLSTVAYAQGEGGGQPGTSFEQLDANGDGALDASELSSAGVGSDQIESMDANADGKISEDEFQSSMGRGGTPEE